MFRTKTLLVSTAIAAVIGLGAMSVPAAAQQGMAGSNASYGQASGWGGGPCGGGYGRHGGRGGWGGPGMMGGPGGMMGGPGGPGGMMLRLADADGDGTVTRAEFDTFHALGFKAMDPDGDGQVTRDEFVNFRMGPGAQAGGWSSWRADRREQRQTWRFNIWDANQDGIVVKAEFDDVAAKHFATLDLDEDGRITVQELNAGMVFGGPGRMMGFQPPQPSQADE